MIYDNAFLSLDGNSLAGFLETVEPSFEVEMGDDTVMGDTARSNEPGLDAWSFSVRVKDPFTDNGPDEIIWDLKGTTFAIVFRPDAGAAAAGNPEYTGTGTWSSWNPVAGNVGDVAIGTLQLVASGALSRAVT